MQIIILAAGKGSRMNSSLPKVMHKVGGKPMIEHVIENCSKVTDDLILVYSDQLKPYLTNLARGCKLVKQEEQLGTAHAVSVAKHLFANDKTIGVIYGDNPLITPNIIKDLFIHLEQTNSKIVTLAFECTKENQYGRIILDDEGNFQKIIESKFANVEEAKITLCNSGIMAFAPGILNKYIDQCITTNHDTGKEFYLTHIIEICSNKEKVSFFKSKEHQLLVGVNTKTELMDANIFINQN